MREATASLTMAASQSIVSSKRPKRPKKGDSSDAVTGWNGQTVRLTPSSSHAEHGTRVDDTPSLSKTSQDWTQAPDSELIEAAQAGSNAAFDALVGRYKSRVFTLAYQKTKSYEDALDITQETFVRAYVALPKWKPQASWFTWLFRIAYNLCIDYHRARGRRRTESLDEPETSLIEPATGDLQSDPARMAEEGELAEIIRAAVEELSDRQKEVFLLHHYGGLQVKEVAETLDIAEGTAKIHLFRAVAKLREILRPLRERNDI